MVSFDCGDDKTFEAFIHDKGLLPGLFDHAPDFQWNFESADGISTNAFVSCSEVLTESFFQSRTSEPLLKEI